MLSSSSHVVLQNVPQQSAIVQRNSQGGWHQRQEVGSKVQEIRSDLINSVWRAGKAARSPVERKHLRHVGVMCPPNKTTVRQHRATWERGPGVSVPPTGQDSNGLDASVTEDHHWVSLFDSRREKAPAAAIWICFLTTCWFWCFPTSDGSIVPLMACFVR